MGFVARKFSEVMAAEIKSKWDALPTNKVGKIGINILAEQYGVTTTTIHKIGRGRYFQKKKYPSQKGKKLSDFPDAFEKWDHDSNPPTIKWFTKEITPGELKASSKKMFNWKCSEGHIWKTSVGGITRGDGCPYCSGRLPTEQNSLEILRPEIAAEFHPTKNGEFTVDLLTVSSGKKVWWQCRNDSRHAWQAPPSRRSAKNSGCPYCSRHKVDSTNCLETTHPEIARLWHPTENGDVSPRDILAGSNTRFWWKCDKGPDHEWETTPNNLLRDSGSSGCPCCAGKKFSVTNSLVVNHPDIAAQWHPTKNGDWRVEDVKEGTQKRTWWKCPEGPDHEWRTYIDARTKIGTGCPSCAGRKASVTNSIASLFPHLMEEWHPTKNGEKTPADFPAGSNRRVWWKCDKGPDHEWRAAINTRTGSGTSVSGYGCPFCSHHKLSVTNSLQTLNPEIASQWHPTKNGDLTPADVVVGTRKRVWWKCPEGPDHEWEGSIGERAGTTSNCPFCENLRVSVTNNLQAIFPDIADEWHPTKNGDLTPSDIVFGSGKKVWWRCKVDSKHEWKTTARHRIGSPPNSPTGCPKCFKKSQSLVFDYVKRIYPEEKVLFDYKHPKLLFSSGRKMELDIYIESLSLAIEYQGEYHFEGFWGGRGITTQSQEIESIQKRDQEKRDACKSLGMTLIEIPYTWDRSFEFVLEAIKSAGISTE